MAYDEGLAQRVRECLQGRGDVEEKNMFGGLCFMVSGHMCCGISGEKLMARVGPDRYHACLEQESASEMDFTGRPLKGMLYVAPSGISSESSLSGWIEQCTSFVATLPPRS